MTTVAPTKLKLIAVTEKGYSDFFKGLVELDSYTISKFTRGGTSKIIHKHGDPLIGQEIDITPILQRLEDLETREREMRAFGELLAKFLPAVETVKPAELDKLREELHAHQTRGHNP